MASTSPTAGFDVFTSADRGASWQRAAVAGLDQLPWEDLTLEVAWAVDGRLRLVVGTSDGRPDRRQVLTSDDGGSTWTAAPCPAGCGDPSEAGGLLRRHGETSRSDDGRSWRQMLPPDPCIAAGIGRANSGMGPPTRFDGHWYVTHDCANLSIPAFGVVYVGDAGARGFEPVEATERDGVSFGDPVVAGDRLISPEFGEDGLVAVTTIR